jgi:hypothetical protein
MKLVYPGYEEKRKNARFKGWAGAMESTHFVVWRDNGDIIADVALNGNSDYAVRFNGGDVVRVIPREQIVPTVRLYLDAQRLRKKLSVADVMFITPVTGVTK